MVQKRGNEFTVVKLCQILIAQTHPVKKTTLAQLYYCVFILPFHVGRPTEVKEEDVYLCSAHYNEDELKFRRNVKGFRVRDKSFLVHHLFFF